MRGRRAIPLRDIPNKIINRLTRCPLVPDEMALKIQFKNNMGYSLNLDSPRTFNEKLQWLKLHDRNPLYTSLVDKCEVKKWVAERIGDQYIVPTLGVWDSFDEIDFETLPDRFVLKCTHDSGSVVICRDKAMFDRAAARRKLNRALRRNFFYVGREWPYKDVKPRILAEEYLDAGALGGPPDYKYFCFGGSAQCVLVCTGRGADLRMDFFDSDWNHLPFTRHYPNADVPPEAPVQFGQMCSTAERLAADLTFVRVDFYEVGGRCYFGEMTLHPASGFGAFDPQVWDEHFGDLLELPSGGGGSS